MIYTLIFKGVKTLSHVMESLSNKILYEETGLTENIFRTPKREIPVTHMGLKSLNMGIVAEATYQAVSANFDWLNSPVGARFLKGVSWRNNNPNGSRVVGCHIVLRNWMITAI